MSTAETPSPDSAPARPTPPPTGTRLQVAEGVHWIRMPLPFALDHINLWTIDEDGPGEVALVDTGTRTDETVAAWQAILAAGPGGAPLRPTRVFVTHMHPDHVGMAGWLTRKHGIGLWMSRLEYYTCRTLTSDTGRDAPAEGVAFYRSAGWSDAALETYRVRFGRFGKYIHPLPDNFRRLHHGQVLRIGAHDWRVIVGSGHSPEHACLHCPALGVLISGDQVLPRISSNVSVYPLEPEADPMRDWLESIERVRQEVPDDVLVLPAHQEPFRGLHARLDELAASQQRVFARLRDLLARGPQRAVDCFEALFNRPIAEHDVNLLSMATGESVACLNHLRELGQVLREPGADGAWRYRLA
ncbi:MAG: MBL fold metallo-hydrolase [Rubrivivax sp.]